MIYQWVSLLVLIVGVALVQLSDVSEQKATGTYLATMINSCMYMNLSQTLINLCMTYIVCTWIYHKLVETVRDLEKTKTWSQEGRGSSSRSQERSWKGGHHLHSGDCGGYDGGGGGRARRSDDDVHTIRLAMVKIDCNMALPSKSAGGTLAPELLTPRCPDRALFV